MNKLKPDGLKVGDGAEVGGTQMGLMKDRKKGRKEEHAFSFRYYYRLHFCKRVYC